MGSGRPVTAQQLLATLADGPARIAAAVGDAPPERLHASPKPGAWSANEVLAHLRACADVWGGCIGRILAEDEPTIRAVNPRTWIGSTDYVEQDFCDSLAALTSQRAALVAVLAPLEPAAWWRRATVTGAGRPLVRTVHDYAAWLARHERPHVTQIQRTVEGLLE